MSDHEDVPDQCPKCGGQVDPYNPTTDDGPEYLCRECGAFVYAGDSKV